MLAINAISMKFGGLVALDSVSLKIDTGKITGLIGPNGAGKTTFFNCVTGIYTPSTGEGTFTSVDGTVHRLFTYPQHQRVKIGIVRTFQNIRLFSKMSVIENVLISTHIHKKYSFLDAVLRTKKAKHLEKQALFHCHNILKTLGIDDLANEIAENLPYGKQRRLEIARALATNPTLLLLDEPAAGMNPNETQELMNIIKHIQETYAVTVFLIEHDMHFVMNLCDTIYVLDYGKRIAYGSPEEVANNPQVIEAYLGAS